MTDVEPSEAVLAERLRQVLRSEYTEWAPRPSARPDASLRAEHPSPANPGGLPPDWEIETRFEGPLAFYLVRHTRRDVWILVAHQAQIRSTSVPAAGTTLRALYRDTQAKRGWLDYTWSEAAVFDWLNQYLVPFYDPSDPAEAAEQPSRWWSRWVDPSNGSPAPPGEAAAFRTWPDAARMWAEAARVCM